MGCLSVVVWVAEGCFGGHTESAFGANCCGTRFVRRVGLGRGWCFAVGLRRESLLLPVWVVRVEFLILRFWIWIWKRWESKMDAIVRIRVMLYGFVKKTVSVCVRLRVCEWVWEWEWVLKFKIRLTGYCVTHQEYFSALWWLRVCLRCVVLGTSWNDCTVIRYCVCLCSMICDDCVVEILHICCVFYMGCFCCYCYCCCYCCCCAFDTLQQKSRSVRVSLGGDVVFETSAHLSLIWFDVVCFYSGS